MLFVLIRQSPLFSDQGKLSDQFHTVSVSPDPTCELIPRQNVPDPVFLFTLPLIFPALSSCALRFQSPAQCSISKASREGFAGEDAVELGEESIEESIEEIEESIEEIEESIDNSDESDESIDNSDDEAELVDLFN